VGSESVSKIDQYLGDRENIDKSTTSPFSDPWCIWL